MKGKHYNGSSAGFFAVVPILPLYWTLSTRSALSSGGCEPRVWPPLELFEVKVLFSLRHRPLGGTNFGTGCRPKSSLSSSSQHCGILPAFRPAPVSDRAAAHFHSDQLLEENNWKKVTAVTVQKHLPPRGFAGTFEDYCVKHVVKGWSIIQKAFGCLCCSSPWLWKDNCNKR